MTAGGSTVDSGLFGSLRVSSADSSPQLDPTHTCLLLRPQGLLTSLLEVAQCVGGGLTLLPSVVGGILTNLPGFITSLLNIPESILNPVTCVPLRQARHSGTS